MSVRFSDCMQKRRTLQYSTSGDGKTAKPDKSCEPHPLRSKWFWPYILGGSTHVERVSSAARLCHQAPHTFLLCLLLLMVRLLLPAAALAAPCVVCCRPVPAAQQACQRSLMAGILLHLLHCPQTLCAGPEGRDQ